jgi:hypothetical protein
MKPEDLAGFKNKMKQHGYGTEEVRKVSRDGARRSTRVCILSLPPLPQCDEHSPASAKVLDLMQRLNRENVAALVR